MNIFDAVGRHNVRNRSFQARPLALRGRHSSLRQNCLSDGQTALETSFPPHVSNVVLRSFQYLSKNDNPTFTPTSRCDFH